MADAHKPQQSGKTTTYGDGTSELFFNNAKLGLFGTAPVAKPTVTGAKGGNAALGSLLTALAALGLLTDSSSA